MSTRLNKIEQTLRRWLGLEKSGVITITDPHTLEWMEFAQVIDNEPNETQIIDFDVLEKRLVEGAEEYRRVSEIEEVV